VIRIRLFAMAFLLALSIACVEIPELLSNSDDTSNDFVVTTSASKPSSLQSPLKCLALTDSCDTNSGVYSCQLCPSDRPQVLSRTGPDLLILHSLQRI
jgi:hypothetical protein